MLQRILQKCRGAYAACDPPLRLLLGGTALLAAILAGGAVTAYGGLLLVVLLWALCMGALAVMLRTVWRLAFPGECPRQDKPFLRAFAAGAVLGTAVIAALVFYRQTVYHDDGVNYYAKQELLLGSFATNGFYGVRELADSLLKADYKMFINLFISVPYLLTNRSIQAFMICYTLTCFLPTWFAGLTVARWLRRRWGGAADARRDGVYYTLCMLAMVLWPMFLVPATHGMPDAFGLAFVCIIFLLTAEFRFETLPFGRLACLYFATFALILTRRWYMYWVVAYYAVYALAVLAGAVRRGCFGRTLKNLLAFGVPSVACIMGPLFLTFQTILTTDYADIYGAYYGGSFLPNCADQLAKQGWIFLLLAAAGLCCAGIKRPLRLPAFAAAGSALLAMALFTHTQSLGDHQSLLLAPAYLGGVFCALAALTSCGRAVPVRLGCGAAAVYFALNCGNALRIPGASISTPLLSGSNLNIERRTDLAAMRAVTDFVLAHCEEGQTVYINLASGGYSGSTFAFSDTAHPQLQSMILWENSVPSTHGFPTGIWTSRYVMVTDLLDAGGQVGGVNTALRTETPAAGHYSYVTEFPLEGVTLYCYERISPPDEAEAAYFKALFAEYDARWPEIYSQRIDGYMASLG